MNLLAIDTSTEACSVALQRADGEVFSEFEIAPRQHMRLLPAMLDRVLADSTIDKNDLTHCAFGNGPGAFTGIRIAAAQAQGIGMALGIPLLPISTLAALAQTAFERCDCRQVLVALDARMQEIYWARYRRGENRLASLSGKENLSTLDDIVIDGELDYGAGHGWLSPLRQRVDFDIDSELLPDARAMLKLAVPLAQAGQGVDASAIEINYLRNRVAEKSRN